jgi:hypothetical protein
MSNEKTTTLQDATFVKLKLQENLSTRRGTMYRFLSSSLQLLLLGNAGGIGFIFGMFKNDGTVEPTWVHWSCILAIIAYLIGCLAAACTVIFSNALAIKEAHAAETAIRLLIQNKISEDEATLYMDDSTFTTAAKAMVSGVSSLVFLVTGSLIGMIVLIFYY